MTFLNMKFSVASAIVLAGSIAVAESKQGRCDENQPIVTDSCISFEDPNVEGILASASCTISSDPDNWVCDGGKLDYRLRETLYFPATNQSILRKSDLQFAMGAWGKAKSEALDQLRKVISHFPGSSIVIQRCGK